ncbi:hypothetical protein HaLaN_16616, partial [Haematococcus lacustris]
MRSTSHLPRPRPSNGCLSTCTASSEAWQSPWSTPSVSLTTSCAHPSASRVTQASRTCTKSTCWPLASTY